MSEERIPMRDANYNRIRRAEDHLKAASVILTNMNGKDMDNVRKAAREICMEKIQDALQSVSSFAHTEAINKGYYQHLTNI